MEQEDSIYNEDYSYPVYSSLTQPLQFFGIGEMAFFVIAMTTIFISSLISWWFLTLGVVAILILRHICKNEPLLMNFIFESLNQAEYYKG